MAHQLPHTHIPAGAGEGHHLYPTASPFLPWICMGNAMERVQPGHPWLGGDLRWLFWGVTEPKPTTSIPHIPALQCRGESDTSSMTGGLWALATHGTSPTYYQLGVTWMHAIPMGLLGVGCGVAGRVHAALRKRWWIPVCLDSSLLGLHRIGCV